MAQPRSIVKKNHRLNKLAKQEEKQHKLALHVQKPSKIRKHKAKELIPATWPHTDDQRKQSRPLIVTHPIRYMGGHFRHRKTFTKHGLTRNSAKCNLDAIAVVLRNL